MQILNRIGERGHPCLTPALKGMFLVEPDWWLTEVALPLYRSKIMLMSSGLTPLAERAYLRDGWGMDPKAFERSSHATATSRLGCLLLFPDLVHGRLGFFVLEPLEASSCRAIGLVVRWVLPWDSRWWGPRGGLEASCESLQGLVERFPGVALSELPYPGLLPVSWLRGLGGVGPLGGRSGFKSRCASAQRWWGWWLSRERGASRSPCGRGGLPNSGRGGEPRW